MSENEIPGYQGGYQMPQQQAASQRQGAYEAQSQGSYQQAETAFQQPLEAQVQQPQGAAQAAFQQQPNIRFAQAVPQGEEQAQQPYAQPGSLDQKASPSEQPGAMFGSSAVAAPARKSKAPWIVLALAILAILIIALASIHACTSMMNNPTLAMFGGPTEVSTSGDTVAVIHIEGTISTTDYENPETFISELSQAEEDPNVVAIVLRISSGGGTAAASEEMAQYVADCSKPVVVSVGDICASGAYMVASQADYIYTPEGATVGSIGVIITQYNISELLNKLGISVESITSGEDKGAGAYWQNLTDEQRAALQEEVNLINDNFIDIVAKGRGLTRQEVAEVATGRTWTGSQMIELELMDEIGTYLDACDKAANLGGAGDDYDVVSFDAGSTTIDISSLL